MIHIAKISLVNPQISLDGWNAPLCCKDGPFIRLGLAYLSSSLKASGHDVKLIDLRLLKGWNDYERLLKMQDPDFVAVTSHTCESKIAMECCRRAKEVNPKVMTVVGGIHATMLPQDFIESGMVDFVLQGEGEISLPKLVSEPQKYPNIFYGETPDLDKLPFPDRELWPDYKKRTKYMFTNFLSKDPLPPPSVDILTGRGCPYRCRFCCGPGEQNLYTSEINGKRLPKIRQMSVKNVMEELTQLYTRYKFKSIIFHDDQFVLNPAWTEEFCKAMHEYGFVEKGIRWFANSRANIIVANPDLFAMMRKAGLKICAVGFESFSDRMLKWLNKGTTAAINREAAQILRRLGVQVMGNFMFGIPYADGKWYFEDDQKNIEALEEIKPEIASISFFTPTPGCDLFNFCKDNKLALDSTSLGTHDTIQSKIVGVDYDFLKQAIFGSIPNHSLVIGSSKFFQKTPFYRTARIAYYELRRCQLTYLHHYR